jgi:hypothetical protein
VAVTATTSGFQTIPLDLPREAVVLSVGHLGGYGGPVGPTNLRKKSLNFAPDSAAESRQPLVFVGVCLSSCASYDVAGRDTAARSSGGGRR